MWNAGLDEAQAVIWSSRRNVNNLRYAEDTTLTAEIKEELKNLLMKVKEEGEKAGLKLNIKKMKVMASSPITAWQTDGKQWKQWQTLFLDSNITADGGWRHEIERRLLLVRKAMTNLDSTLKSRGYFASKGPYSQSYGFSSSHECLWEMDHKESWALKNWCFWTVVLEKTLESPLDCKVIKLVH